MKPVINTNFMISIIVIIIIVIIIMVICVGK